LYGICFCSNLTRIDASNFQAIKSVIATFCMNAIGYMFGKKNVKTTCSYGPIKTKRNLIEARFAAKHIFDVMCAREYESARQMTEVAGVKKEIFVAPDIANLMPFQQKKNSDVRTIGISISHQIIRQWQATESYLECMVKLILHILTLTDCNILLIPNEVVDKAKYNDSHVADDILKRLESNNRRVSILNVAELNSSTIKSEIAACEVMIASRYHSCVAALSAGVPTLVIGWHYKYDELLKFYGQEKWIISNENCNSNLLIEKFDDFWQQRNVSKSEIAKKYPEVRARVLESGRRMFMK